MRLAGDVSGVESLPLRLLVVSVVAALSVIPASEALDTLRDKEFVRRADAQLTLVTTTAEILCVQGPGAARTLSLDFSSHGSVRFSRLVLGDASGGPGMCCALLEMSSGVRLVAVADEPPVWMCSPAAEGFEVRTPVFELRMSAVLWEGVVAVFAEAV